MGGDALDIPANLTFIEEKHPEGISAFLYFSISELPPDSRQMPSVL
jgi:hypothetical protein